MHNVPTTHHELDVGEAHTLSDLVRIGRVLQVAARSNLWYRGHEKFDKWKLQPKLFRDGYDSKAEREMLGGFCTQSQAIHAQCPPVSDPVAWLCWGQHYKLPTRLLDWSGSLLVAAYFAVKDAAGDNDDSAIWALSQGIINHYLTGKSPSGALHEALLHYPSKDTEYVAQSGFSLRSFAPHYWEVVWDHPKNADLKQKRKTPEAIDVGDQIFLPGIKAVAVTSPHPEIRMRVQQGAFTFHNDESALEDIPEARKGLHRIRIPAAYRREFRYELAAICGIHEASLFPDPEHLAEQIRANTIPNLRKALKAENFFKPNAINVVQLDKFPLDFEFSFPAQKIVSFTDYLDSQVSFTTAPRSMPPLGVEPGSADESGRVPMEGERAEVQRGSMKGFVGRVEKFDPSSGIAELAFNLFGLRQIDREVRAEFLRNQFKLL
jgi:hypothetical protein